MEGAGLPAPSRLLRHLAIGNPLPVVPVLPSPLVVTPLEVVDLQPLPSAMAPLRATAPLASAVYVIALVLAAAVLAPGSALSGARSCCR